MRHIKYGLWLLLTALTLTFNACKSDSDATSDTMDIDEDDDQTTATVGDSYVYQLPVIFHVFYKDKNDTTQYIPASLLTRIINNVNEIYQGNVYGESENINVKFHMAITDENKHKLATPGVEYIQYTGTLPIDCETFMKDKNNVQYLWEPNDYINIMLYPFKAGSDGTVTLGISHMPYALEGDTTLAGLTTVPQSNITKRNLSYPHCSSINSLYVYDESSRYYLSDKGKSGYSYNSTDINVTIAHELGHYLGLLHMFTEHSTSGGFEPADSCGDTDYCKDTPSYNKVEYDTYLTDYMKTTTKDKFDLYDLLRRTNCDGQKFYSANIMDYAVSFSYKLSADQKSRIRNVLYSCPLIPGPKKSTTRAIAKDGIMDLPVRTIK
jgi:zinc-dependent metalloproteinase lipoprotein